MRWGYDHPYDALPTAPDAAWALYGETQPTAALVMSHTPIADIDRILNENPIQELVIRCKMGPQHQNSVPGNGLTYQEWEGSNAPTAEDVIQIAQDHGVPSIVVQLYNEIDIEATDQADEISNRVAVADSYRKAWNETRAYQREHYPDVKLAAAPLSQGNNERFEWYCVNLAGVYEDSDIVIEHCYSNGRDVEDPEWGGRWQRWREWFPMKRIVIGEHNDNGHLYWLGASERERGQAYGNYIRHMALINAERPDQQDQGVPLFAPDTVILFEAPATPGGDAWWPITVEMGTGILDVIQNLPTAGSSVEQPDTGGGETDPGWPYGERPWSQDEIVARSHAAADQYGMPRRMMLGLLCAESRLDQYARRPKTADKDQSYWTDVSAGLAQQTVRWSSEYINGPMVQGGHNPAKWPGAAEIERCFQPYWNPDHAIAVGAKQLSGYWQKFALDQLETLCRYNKPNMPGVNNPNRANYQDGLDMADAIIAAENDPGDPGGGTGGPPVAGLPMELHEDHWRAILGSECSFNPLAGIEKTWFDHGAQLGPTESADEVPGEPNERGAAVVFRRFAGGYIRWDADTGPTVVLDSGG